MISLLKARLESELSGDFNTITHASDQQPIDDIVEELPMLAVFPGDDDTDVDPTDNIESKMVNTKVFVHVICLVEELEALREKVREQVLGWSPGAKYTDMSLHKGSLIKLKAGIIWWEETYTTRYLIRASS